MYPIPNLATHDHIMIEATNGVTHQKSRPLRRHELLTALGHEKHKHEWMGHDKWTATYNRLRRTTPRQTWEKIVATLHSLELETRTKQRKALTGTDEQTTAKRTMIAKVINRWTTLPEPTEEDWRYAVATDHDLSRIKLTLEQNQQLLKAALHEKRYFGEWTKGKLEVEKGIVYQYEEPKATKIRQLRRRVVPKRLRDTIITAYHATPMAGHTGYYKTYWRIAAQFYWPGMSSDVRAAVTECGHCQAANVTGHENQQILSGLLVDEPFDIISIDVWHPGKTTMDTKKLGTERNQKAILTSTCNLTGFASLAFISVLESEVAARLVFSHFFIPNELLKVIVIDAGSEFKGMLIMMSEILGVQYYVAPPEDHNAISTERFHRYLNKVPRIHQADTQSYER
jgi:hypothetical protein